MADWRHARVVGVHGDKLEYAVEYDDGTVATELCRYCVRPFQSYQPGEHVGYDLPDDDDGVGLVWGEIVGANPQSDRYDVVISEGHSGDDDDERSEGELVQGITSAALRRVELGDDNLEIGTQVVARHPRDDDDGQWYRAVIHAFHEDVEQYDVRFLEHLYDGAIVKSIDPENVRRYAWAQ